MDYKEHLTKLGQAMSLAGFMAFVCKPFEVSNPLTTILSASTFLMAIILLYLSELGKYLSKEKLIILLLAISIFYNAFTINNLRNRNNADGITKYYSAARDIYPDLDSKLANVTNSLWFYGTNFHITVDDKRGTILDLVKNGVRVKFLVLDPKTSYYDMVSKTIAPGEPLQSLKTECIKGIVDLMKLQNDAKNLIMSSGAQGSIEVKLIDVIPHNRIYLFDPENSDGSEIFVPYLNGLLSAQSPAYFLNAASNAGQCHYRAANQMWSTATDIKDWFAINKDDLMN